MSGKKSKPGKAKSSKRIPKSYILAVGIVVIICIVIVAGFVIIKQGATAANTSANTTPFNQAGALYLEKCRPRKCRELSGCTHSSK